MVWSATGQQVYSKLVIFSKSHLDIKYVSKKKSDNFFTSSASIKYLEYYIPHW